MATQIDNVGIALVCRRTRDKITTRTFKGSCGSYIRAKINGAGTLVAIEKMHNYCKRDCAVCAELVINTKKLIQSGK